MQWVDPAAESRSAPFGSDSHSGGAFAGKSGSAHQPSRIASPAQDPRPGCFSGPRKGPHTRARSASGRRPSQIEDDCPAGFEGDDGLPAELFFQLLPLPVGQQVIVRSKKDVAVPAGAGP